jgi:excisionase family DNA binding protein
MDFLYSLDNAAEALGGISVWTLRKHIAQGHIRVTRIGRRILLGADELERIRREGLPSLRIQTT